MTFVGACIIGLTEAFWAIYRTHLGEHFHVLLSSYLDTIAAAIPIIILFVVLLVLPNPRLRGHARLREFFPTPSWPGSLAFAAILVVGTIVISAWVTQSHEIDLANVFAFGIIALSLVPLAGFSGQVSLAQLTFAGIGAVTMAHLGQNGNPIGLVWAALIAGGVGALVAIPALRLSGIYLALATAAFAVALDRWVFTLQNFSVFGWFKIKLFESGSVGVDRLKIGGVSFQSHRAQAVLCALVFSILALLVVAIRRSAFGRRLLAMKDSEAACATLGMNLVGTKVIVFALSAAIAGIGGALYGGVQQSVNPQNFSFINGLPIFMLTVVGGVGAIGGALFAGIALSLLTLLPDIIPSLQNVLLVTPGLIGISLGRNPNGAVSQIRDGFAPLTRWRPALVAFWVLLLGVWALRSFDVIDNWTAVVLAYAALIVPTGVADLRERRTKAIAEHAEKPVRDDLPLEWVGITRPFTDDDVLSLNTALGVSEVELYGAAGG